MVNILSIDLDWIMEPSIQFYNNICKENDVDALAEVQAGTILNADLNKYAQLSNFLFTKCSHLKPSDVIVTESHANFPAAVHQWNINKNFTVYNIDHHHDCGYLNDGDPIEKVIDVDGCGSWVPRTLKINKYFSHYVWIGNKNSDTYISDNLRFYLPLHDFTTDIDILNNIEINKLYICKSFAWIPLEYRPLLNSLIVAFVNFINKEK